MAIVLLFLFSNCNSAKRVTYKRNNFLLTGRIDTLKIKASELVVHDSSIVPCLDALINNTKRLGEYDKRIEPLYWIQFRRFNGSISIDFESNNLFESLDEEVLFGEKNPSLFPKTEYELLIYGNVKFIVTMHNDDSAGTLSKIKESYLEKNNVNTHFDSYRFSSAEGKIIENFLMWSYTDEYSDVNNRLSFQRTVYHSINRPLIVVH